MCLSALQELDAAVIPAAHKAQMRDEVSVLQRRVMDLAKASAAANKAAAVAAAVAAAADASQAGRSYVVLNLSVGSDAKALLEAWNAMTAAAPSMAGLFISSDESKAVVYAAVPEAMQAKLKANEWASAVLQVVDGKGGGKSGVSQGQGAAVGKVPEAVSVAEQFAKLRL